MNTLITFIIPVRHPANSKNWSRLKANLAQTICSISAQTNTSWRAVIVANEGADIPDIPSRFEIVRVTFPPNDLHDNNGEDIEAFYDAVRLDKGRRVLMGMLHARDTNFYMIVDDDDFVSNNLVAYVADHRNDNGWKVVNGYVWGDGGNLLYIHNDFSNFCGTSLIIRSNLYQLPADYPSASDSYIKTMLGSHIKIGNILAQQGTPLSSLPFIGAVYRIGHAGSHSKSPKIMHLYYLNKYYLLRPLKLLNNLCKLRFVTNSFKREFFGVL